MNILISSPYAIDSLNGNTVSSKRIAKMLEEAGHEVQMIQSGSLIESRPDALIALHAKKSYSTITTVHQHYPDAKIILYLTGTDLYDDLPNGCGKCAESLTIADHAVVSQDASFHSIPQSYQKKSAVVYNSIQLPKLEPVEVSPSHFFIASHLRSVKQPFMVVEALAHLPEPVAVSLAGKVIDPDSKALAEKWMLHDSRFHWLGEQSYHQTLQKMQQSVATINTSLAEGGANSVGESIVLGRPVLATRIEGNIGMLGEDYSGYFDPHEPKELATLMQQIYHDVEFRITLEQQVKQRAKKYCRVNERDSWLALLES